MPAPAPLPVFSLQCHKHIEMALDFLPTLLKHCLDPIELIILDDGSLTAEDCDRLRDALGPVRIISRAEGDDLISPRLASKPRCVAYRQTHPFGLKLLDSALIAGGEAFVMVDGDVRFLRDFRHLDRRGTPEAITFMQDTKTWYQFSRMSMAFGPYRARRPEYVNAGLLYCNGRAFDLDFIEWYLSNPKFEFWNHLAEQTTWAALAGRVKSSCFDPVQVSIPEPGMTFPPGLVALHYVGPRRFLQTEPEHLSRSEAYSRDVVGGEAVAIRTQPATYRSLAGTVIRAAYGKLGLGRPHPVADPMGHAAIGNQEPRPADQLATSHPATTLAPPRAQT